MGFLGLLSPGFDWFHGGGWFSVFCLVSWFAWALVYRFVGVGFVLGLDVCVWV